MNSDIGEGSTILWRGIKNVKVADEFDRAEFEKNFISFAKERRDEMPRGGFGDREGGGYRGGGGYRDREGGGGYRDRGDRY